MLKSLLNAKPSVQRVALAACGLLLVPAGAALAHTISPAVNGNYAIEVASDTQGKATPICGSDATSSNAGQPGEMAPRKAVPRAVKPRPSWSVARDRHVP